MASDKIFEGANLYDFLPEQPENEVLDVILQRDDLKIERIVSYGHSSPDGDWYDQTYNEWVVVLQGEALMAFEGADDVQLQPGAYINIPAHCRHRVSWTAPDTATIWLAIHY
jgi:cupin 2 domain-containing protein